MTITRRVWIAVSIVADIGDSDPEKVRAGLEHGLFEALAGATLAELVEAEVVGFELLTSGECEAAS